MENLSDTIVAISTGSTNGAISIVRLSGKNAIEIADGLFESAKHKKPSALPARYLELGKVKTKGFVEQAMCVVFRAPASYTGEDLVEIQCHGGLKIAHGIVEECISLGARLATNGEFTKRAFINGKMSLASAEGVMDIINAESDAQVRAGYNLLSGGLSKIASEAQDELTDLMSEIEVSFDYPEEQIEYITKANTKQRLKNLSDKLQKTLDTAGAGNLISNGINVLIVGKPNVGKSSLLNKLLDRERAIVTDIPGTTRDTIEDSFSINGIKVKIIDTAGIHDTTDMVEKMGVDKAKNLIDAADIVLFVTDASKPLTDEDKKIFDLIKSKQHIEIANKADISHNNSNKKAIVVSSLTGEGIEELKQEIFKRFESPNLVEGGVIITNERHKQALSVALENINNAIREIDCQTLDLISIDLKLAYSSLGEITGNTTGEDIIDAIFSKFCLGK
ncbi:MAG: tRNA uridine-5-carboxymethylaminomethyl(34) synthesis GTPase MnmE [Clostridia bacterium]|nr:tRNA uridine-5-carboxymethylaminomethyl(34) synthesis GTPase MnmE [Clostridia bacterium]